MTKKSILDTDKELRDIIESILDRLDHWEQEFIKRQPLTDKQRQEIIESEEPIYKLAAKYNRSRQQIYNIRNKSHG